MILDLIQKKVQGKALTQDDFYEAIDYLMKRGADSHAIKFFVALNNFGMNKYETLYFACAIRDSGRVLHFHETIFDKHSTGGIGDASSLVIIPLLASLGYKVIKTTGKSLVYTNGSADRFKAIPIFNVKLDNDQIEEALHDTNACVLSHNGDMCPADRILYDIREKHGIDSNLNFIAASIASKKLASGAKVVLVDIKFGLASIVKTYRNAKKLARLLKFIFDKSGVKSVFAITSTEQTFGEGVGNAIEVVDAVHVLQGKRSFLRKVANKFAVEMMIRENKELNKADAYDMVNMAIDTGAAYKQFLDIVKEQGGDSDSIENATFFKPYNSVNFVTKKTGYVGHIDSLILGEVVRRLCAESHDDNIGVVLRVKIGDYVKYGDVIMTFYYKDQLELEKYKDVLRGAVRLTDQKVKKIRVVKKVVG